MAAPPGYEYEHFKLQAVSQYPEYVKIREKCTQWSKPTSIANHTIHQMQAKYPFPMTEANLREHSRHFFAGCGPLWDTMVQTCTLPKEIDANGELERQWTFTRVGPMGVGPDAFVCLALIPTMPTELKTRFVIAASDAYFADLHDGRGFREVGYPPLHPHHSNAFMVGYHPSLTQHAGASFNSPFERFYPWAAFSTRQLDQFGAQSSMNAPGFNADFVGCRPSEDTSLAACSYMRMPAGQGWPIYKGTDMWSTSLINRCGSWREPPGTKHMQVIFEYGRQFASAAPTSTRRPASALVPVWTLDFAVVGNGNTYELGRYAKLEAVMFHTYWMPVGGRVVGSWFHTHAQAKSEFWILSEPYTRVLPPNLVAECGKRGICKDTGARANGTTGSMAMALKDTGIEDVVGLQAYIRGAAAPTKAVKCEYKSVADREDNSLWGRQSVRTIGSRNTCDGWAFNADSPITLIAFNYAQSGIMQQHNRWFTVMELSIPKPPGALAGFRTEKVTPVEANQPAPDTRSEEAKYNDWMEFMG